MPLLHDSDNVCDEKLDVVQCVVLFCLLLNVVWRTFCIDFDADALQQFS